MKWNSMFFYKWVLIVVTICSLVSCDFKEREQAIATKEQELILREQQLSLREQDLTSREEKLQHAMHLMDSTQNVKDSIGVYNESLVGSWNVKMLCTETNCVGSAIGDVKVEKWLIGYENNQIVAKVFAKKSLVRIYNGYYTGSTLKLSQIDTSSATEMQIELSQDEKDLKKLKGTRSINKPNCKIVYSVDADKSQKEIQY